MKLDELIEGYLSSLRARQCSQSFSAGEKTLLNLYRRYCAGRGVVDADDITFQHLLDYADSLKALSGNTRYQMLGAVRRGLKWATYRGHLLENPAAGWKSRRPRQVLRRVPTPQEMEALLAAPCPDTPQGLRDQVLLEFLYGTGLRVKECAQVMLYDLELGDGVADVHGKGGFDRRQPLGPHLVGKLRHYLEHVRPQLTRPGQTAALFPHDQGGALQAQGIAQRMRDYSQQIGSTPFTVHSIRHAFATHLLLNGAPLWAVQKLLGHQVLSSTATYTQLLPIDVQAEIMRTHPRAKARPRDGESGKNPES